jgi:uncharacterized membrane protein YcgQ (UPF0703/DUF1980 family)
VLIVPIVLFFLDLPRDKKPRFSATVNLTEDAVTYTSIVAVGFDPLSQLCMAASYYSDQIDPKDAKVADFKELEQARFSTATMDFWKGKVVSIVGQYNPKTDHVFGLVRFRIQCCAADAVPLNVIMVCKEPVTAFKIGDWVEVVGRIDFQQQPDGRYVTILRIPKRDYVQPTPVPSNPYVQ